jgi:hypothetical protein
VGEEAECDVGALSPLDKYFMKLGNRRLLRVELNSRIGCLEELIIF